jgi:hypothetical protein
MLVRWSRRSQIVSGRAVIQCQNDVGPATRVFFSFAASQPPLCLLNHMAQCVGVGLLFSSARVRSLRIWFRLTDRLIADQRFLDAQRSNVASTTKGDSPLFQGCSIFMGRFRNLVLSF